MDRGHGGRWGLRKKVHPRSRDAAARPRHAAGDGLERLAAELLVDEADAVGQLGEHLESDVGGGADDALHVGAQERYEGGLLERPGYFEYEDAALRALQPVQKQLSLLGPENRRAVLQWRREVARHIDWFTRAFEPALMAALGIAVGLVVVLMYMPIFELAGSIR